MTARRKLIAGNWKMNGLKADGLDLASDLAGRLKGAGPVAFDMLVCPPFPLLFPVGEAIADSPLALGGQDCAPKTSGAHTGDVAPTMLKDAGCRFVILGHSERRADHGESDAVVNAKAVAAHKEGLVAIVCVGETEAQRDAGQANAVVSGQLAGSIPAGANAENTVIAYEPVWAIGTGLTPTLEQIEEVHAAVRAAMIAKLGDGGRVAPILYGGSVKPSNAKEILAVAEVGGALVGGASLKAEDFLGIIRAV